MDQTFDLTSKEEQVQQEPQSSQDLDSDSHSTISSSSNNGSHQSLDNSKQFEQEIQRLREQVRLLQKEKHERDLEHSNEGAKKNGKSGDLDIPSAQIESAKLEIQTLRERVRVLEKEKQERDLERADEAAKKNDESVDLDSPSVQVESAKRNNTSLCGVVGLSEELRALVEKQKELMIKAEEAKSVSKKLHLKRTFTKRIVERSRILAGNSNVEEQQPGGDEDFSGSTEKIARYSRLLERKYAKACVKERKTAARLAENTKVLEEKMAEEEAERGERAIITISLP